MSAGERVERARRLLASAGPTRVKLCGMSRPQDVAAVNAARPDLCGFIVDFPKSRRNVPAGELAGLSAEVEPDVVRVGVFVDAPVSTIAGLVEAGAIDAVQLHGREDEAYLASLRARADAPVIQAFRVRTPEDVERAEASAADMVLLDNGQGTGKAFDWSLVRGVTRPFMLAGGLEPGNVAEAIRQVRPWGVDMSSGIETDGLKDPQKIDAAVAAVRRAGND